MGSFTKSTFVKKFTITFTIVTFAYLCACNKPTQYKNGDKIFLTSKLINGTPNGFQVNLSQLIEPINGHGEAYVQFSKWAISVDSLKKYNSANIGSYLQQVALKASYKGKYRLVNYYAILPNQNALIKTDMFTNIPKGYRYAKAPFYIFPAFTNPHETIIKK